MTVAAVTFANMSSQPRSPTSYQSTYSDPSPTATTYSPSTHSSSSNSPTTPTQPVATTETSAPTGRNEVPIRSIDPDIQAAFEDAVVEVISRPTTTAQGTVTVDSDAGPSLPPLETKEVWSSPKVFDGPITGTRPDQTDIQDRFLTTTDLNMREGPAPAYLKVGTLANGTELIVLEREGKWWHVKTLVSGADGWVNGTFLKPKM